jgi:N-acetylglucosaminyldiphosphoundecaprenol N-acetyl-beta-D-mannosaminyltransferase
MSAIDRDGRVRGPSPLETRHLLGFDFVSALGYAAIVDVILDGNRTDALLPLVVTPNVDYVVRCSKPANADLAAAIRRARLVLPDGQPIVWASRLLGATLESRLAGSGLVPILWGRIVAEARPAMVIASSDRVAALLRAEHPELVTYVPPLFDDGDEASLRHVIESCAALIEEAKPEVVFVGISFPKQLRVALGLIDALRDHQAESPMFLLIGGSFEMYLGVVKRAPEWMQRAGLEWMFRFLQEPRRLVRRYFVDDLRFIPILAAELWTSRRHRGHRHA